MLFNDQSVKSFTIASSPRMCLSQSRASERLLRDRERLAGRDTQVDSETCNARKERAYERLRASQWNITAAKLTRYRCVELEVVLNVG